jgi:RNA polymerase primary sigma factor
MLSTFERYGIDVYEDVSIAEEVEVDLTPGRLEKTNDPVRMYLREMGTVPLLTREGEVAIAKRLERGQMLVLKTLSRFPIVIKELVAIGEELRKGTRSTASPRPTCAGIALAMHR